MAGSKTLTCIPDVNGTKGAWDGIPLSCVRSVGFCPGLHPINASLVLDTVSYKLDAIVSLQCLRGFRYLVGDTKVRCALDAEGNGICKRTDGKTALEGTSVL